MIEHMDMGSDSDRGEKTATDDISTSGANAGVDTETEDILSPGVVTGLPADLESGIEHNRRVKDSESCVLEVSESGRSHMKPEAVPGEITVKTEPTEMNVQLEPLQVSINDHNGRDLKESVQTISDEDKERYQNYANSAIKEEPSMGRDGLCNDMKTTDSTATNQDIITAENQYVVTETTTEMVDKIYMDSLPETEANSSPNSARMQQTSEEEQKCERKEPYRKFMARIVEPDQALNQDI